jgi:hypothetical protein
VCEASSDGESEDGGVSSMIGACRPESGQPVGRSRKERAPRLGRSRIRWTWRIGDRQSLVEAAKIAVFNAHRDMWRCSLQMCGVVALWRRERGNLFVYCIKTT